MDHFAYVNARLVMQEDAPEEVHHLAGLADKRALVVFGQLA
jgi:hypothetical protein